MKNIVSKNINHYLETSTYGLKALFVKVRALQKWQEQVEVCLKASLRPYCQVANRSGNRLILIAANGTVATELRFQQHHLLMAFKDNPALRSIQHIDIKVRPFAGLNPRAEDLAPHCPMSPLSANSAAIVASTAASLADPKLKAIMQRIAERTKG